MREKETPNKRNLNNSHTIELILELSTLVTLLYEAYISAYT